MAVSALTLCALLHFVCDLKVIQINVQYSLIWELVLYKLELSDNTTGATKKHLLCKVAVDYSNQMVQEILIGFREPQQLGKVS